MPPPPANGALCLSTHKHNDKPDTGYLSIISDGSLSTQYDVAHFLPAGLIFLYVWYYLGRLYSYILIKTIYGIWLPICYLQTLLFIH